MFGVLCEHDSRKLRIIARHHENKPAVITQVLFGPPCAFATLN